MTVQRCEITPETNEDRSASFDLAFGQSAATPYGTVSFPISYNGAATDHFTHGLALLHHMMYGEAGVRFRQAADADPSCAMAHWGAAMSELHPLWAAPTGTELERRDWWETAGLSVLYLTSFNGNA